LGNQPTPPNSATFEVKTVQYYFVVLNATGVIESVVQRNAVPPRITAKKFIRATGVELTFYQRLLESQGVVTLADVQNY